MVPSIIYLLFGLFIFFFIMILLEFKNCTVHGQIKFLINRRRKREFEQI